MLKFIQKLFGRQTKPKRPTTIEDNYTQRQPILLGLDRWHAPALNQIIVPISGTYYLTVNALGGNNPSIVLNGITKLHSYSGSGCLTEHLQLPLTIGDILDVRDSSNRIMHSQLSLGRPNPINTSDKIHYGRTVGMKYQSPLFMSVYKDHYMVVF